MKTFILFVIFMIPGLVMAQDVVKLAKLNKDELGGKIFEHPNITTNVEDGVTEHGFSSMTSSDEKFESGVFKSTPGRYEYDEPFGVNEFMYILEGTLTLTSSDGSVMVVGPGEAVTVPKEWTGVWEDTGYTKIYVIYK